MKTNLMRAFVIGALGIFLANFASAQDSRVVAAAGDQYVISAKAGGVNYLEGKVSVFRKDGTSGYLLKGDELQIGDRVSTAADGKAEILLNPGSYMRLGGNTAFEFKTTSLDDLKLDLKAGSAVFEVMAADEFKVSIHTPKADVELTRSGVFRVDVLSDGTSKLSVFKGKVFFGPRDTEIESGRTAIVSGSQSTVTKFDRDTNDPLDIWSKARAKELTKINAALQRNSLRNTLLNSYNRGGWNMYNSFGLWVFDPVRRMWCFMPFGYGWNSPYGWDYNFDLWSCRLPRWYYWSGPTWYPPPPTGSGPTGPVRTPLVTAGDRSPTPPFVRMAAINGSPVSSSGRTITDNPSSGPVWSPSPPSSSPPPAPPPSSSEMSKPSSSEMTKGKP